jgi:hypothetical protein
VRLDDNEVQATYYGLAGFVRERAIAHRPVPPEVLGVYHLFDAAIRLSRRRHESGAAATDTGPSDSWLGAVDTAARLDRSLRWVQRHAAEIGGETVGGRWLFKETAVTDYAERLAAHGRTSPRA